MNNVGGMAGDVECCQQPEGRCGNDAATVFFSPHLDLHTAIIIIIVGIRSSMSSHEQVAEIVPSEH